MASTSRAGPTRLVSISKTIESGKIEHVPENKGIKYIALSHVWSRKNKEQDHTGVPWKVEAFAFDNMMELIKILKQYCDERLDKCDALWVDAYCINQSSPEDKNLEIPRMGKYYNHAIKVIVLPNGVDRLHSPITDFRNREGYTSEWVQRVWTVPEIYFAKSSCVVFSLDKDAKYAAESAKSAKYAEHVKYAKSVAEFAKSAAESAIPAEYAKYAQFAQFAKSVAEFAAEHAAEHGAEYAMEVRNKKIFFTNIETYNRMAHRIIKSSKSLKTYNIIFDNEKKVESLCDNRLLISSVSNLTHKTNTKLNLVSLIHAIAIRNCSNDVDRIYTILPMLGINKTITIDSTKSLEDAMIDVFCMVKNPEVMAYLVLSVARCHPNFTFTGGSVFPDLIMLNEEEAKKQLVCIDKTLKLRKGLTMKFERYKGLIIKNTRVASNISVYSNYHHNIIYYNIGYMLKKEGMLRRLYKYKPREISYNSAGKCNKYKTKNLTLIEIGKTEMSDVNRSPLYHSLYIESNLVCCIVCNEYMKKTGVLMVPEEVFNSLEPKELEEFIIV
jgi:hypothetical protein